MEVVVAKTINDLFTVQPVNQITKTVALGTYNHSSGRQKEGEYQSFSQILKEAEEIKKTEVFEKSAPNPSIYYNKHARITYLIK